ncbi:AAA-like domain-containing protein [Desulfococcaceae bacterium HSG7]|nr:AAA-like domain-containing protein [Desulfococcaceae bacterium HSG7]
MEKDFDKSIKSCLLFLLRSTENYKRSEIYNMIETIRNIMLKEGMLGKPSLIFIFGEHDVQEKYISRSYQTQSIADVASFKRLLLNQNPRKSVISKLKPLESQSALCPFYHVGPCETEMFIGREELIENIVFGKKVAYAVSGGRRIGKSSLLFKIMHDVDQGIFSSIKYHPLYIDCSNFTSFRELTDHITRKLFPQIYHTKRYLKKKNPLGRYTKKKTGNKPPPSTEKKKNYLTGRVDFEYILSRTQLENKTLLLLLDEMDSLIKHAKIKSKDSKRFFNSIRAETNTNRIKFIISGFRHVSNMINDSSHPFNNLCIGTQLDPLTENETFLLITRPLSKFDISIEAEDKIIHRIYESTGGHPSVIQFIARHLFTHRQGNVIKKNNLDNAFRDKDLINFVLDNFLMNTNALERLLCLFFLNKDEITLEPAIDVFKQKVIIIKNMDKKINDALRNLKYNNIFSQDENNFQFLYPMMKGILKNYYDAPNIRILLEQEVQNDF